MASSIHSDTDSREDSRDESPLERLDRNTTELLQELRVAVTGVQVMLAFLLVVPFNTRFTRLSSFERYDYFVTLVCVAIAAVLLMSPSIHHRLLFRTQQKPFLVELGNRTTILGMTFLAAGFIGILVLISDLMWGGVAAAVVGVVTVAVIGGLWFGLPLRRRREVALRASRERSPDRLRTRPSPRAAPHRRARGESTTGGR
jgi:O-antigen/teichoic acid export membrane protein